MDDNSTKTPQDPTKNSCVLGLFWWTTLAVAVIAVPSFGFVVSYIFPFRGLGALVVFILACWLCTYLGMQLMSNPKMSKNIYGRRKDD